MLVVDSQIHIWGSNLPTNPAHRQITSFTADDVLREMDEAGVDAAVIHPPGWDPGSDAMALEAASQHPNRLSILGKFPLDDPASRSTGERLEATAGYAGTCASPSSSRTSSLGRPTARWTGCGRRQRRRGCPSA